jgi:hypothetical protein
VNDATVKRIRQTAAVLTMMAAAAFVVSCKTTGAEKTPPGPPDFQAGYSDGCDSGFGDAGRRGMEDVWVKNGPMFNNNPQYHEGWLQGYAACYQSEENQPMLGQR